MQEKSEWSDMIERAVVVIIQWERATERADTKWVKSRNSLLLVPKLGLKTQPFHPKSTIERSVLKEGGRKGCEISLSFYGTASLWETHLFARARQRPNEHTQKSISSCLAFGNNNIDSPSFLLLSVIAH